MGKVPSVIVGPNAAQRTSEAAMSLEWNSILGSRVDGRIFATNLTNKLYRISSVPGLNSSFG